MIDIASFNKSLKATWVKKYLGEEISSKWKTIFDEEFGKYGGTAVIKVKLNKKDVNNLKLEDVFDKEITEIWSKPFLSRKSSKERFLVLPLWQN